jgi:hypothetical protein
MATTTSVYVDPNTGGVQAGLMQFRNGIINGNFDVWQRGTTFNAVASTAYTADRWQVTYDAGGTPATRAITQQSFIVGQTDVPNNPKFYLRFVTSVAGAGATFVCITQKVEGVRSFAGKKITISFWAKGASALNIYGILQQVFGTGGSPSSMVQTNAPTLSISTLWQRYSWTVDLPSVAGKTIGTNNDDYINILFALPLNVIFTFDLAQVQVEEGQRATPFEVRHLAIELQLCHRYYQDISKHIAGHVNAAVNYSVIAIKFNVMRTVPSVVNNPINFSISNYRSTNHTLSPDSSSSISQFAVFYWEAYPGAALLCDNIKLDAEL